MTTAINYLDGPIAPDREQEALENLCNYLVSKGKYKDLSAATKDADERVDFLEKADIYADDPKMADASRHLKAIHALIAAHHLNSVLQANGGELPEAEKPVSGSAKGKSSRSITDVFGGIELDLRTGLSHDQIISKLEDDGISTENAEEAYQFVYKQRRKKQQTRLLAGSAIVVLSVAFYFLSDLFL